MLVEWPRICSPQLHPCHVKASVAHLPFKPRPHPHPHTCPLGRAFYTHSSASAPHVEGAAYCPPGVCVLFLCVSPTTRLTALGGQETEFLS